MMYILLVASLRDSAASDVHVSPRAAAPPPPAPPGPSNEQIAGYLNAGIWGVVFLLILVNLPRAISRWRHPSARKHGILLKASKTGRSSPTTVALPALSNAPVLAQRPYVTGQASDSSIDKNQTEILTSDKEGLGTPVEGPITGTSLPSRVASWASLLHPFSRYLGKPFWFTGYSIGLALAFAVYTGIISFGMLYRNLPSFGPRR